MKLWEDFITIASTVNGVLQTDAHAYKTLTIVQTLKRQIMTKLNYDIDNFSGRNGRGTRYDIKADGMVVYHDIAEEAVDKLCEEMEHKPWLYNNIEVVELN